MHYSKNPSHFQEFFIVHFVAYLIVDDNMDSFEFYRIGKDEAGHYIQSEKNGQAFIVQDGDESEEKIIKAWSILENKINDPRITK